MAKLDLAEQRRAVASMLTASPAEPGPDPASLNPADFDADLAPVVALWCYMRQDGQGPPAAAAKLRETLPHLAAALVAVDPDAPAPGLRVLSAREILTTEWPEPKSLVPGLLVIGLNILAGRPKVGKSWLALQLAHAVSAGGVTLGQQVEQGPALYLALEDSPARLKKRMLMQRWNADRSPADFVTMRDFADQIGSFRGEGLARLAGEIRSRGYRLVVVDTFSRAVMCDQDRVHEVTAALSPLQELAHTLNCAILVVDHHRKSADGDNPLQDILGSVAKPAVADAIWGLYKQPGKAGAVLKVEGRDIDDQTLELTFDRLTGAWQVQATANGMPLAGSRADVLEAVRNLGQATMQEVRELAGLDKGNAYRYLQDLVSGGYLYCDKTRRPACYSVASEKQLETVE